MKTAKLSNIRRNIMGTTSFGMKAGSMRKPQDFIVYPIKGDESAQEIQVQSDNYIGVIDMETGEGKLSGRHSHPGFTAYQMDQQFDKLQAFKLSNLDHQALKLQIFTSSDSEAGESIVKSDNSGAVSVLDI